MGNTKSAKKNLSQRGFTLVELSIVLVIIGLLVGGIIVANSMVGTAKTQQVISQVTQYDVALENFKSKYNGIPGDSKFYGSGNGNGFVEDDSGTLGLGATFTGEVANYWVDLEHAGDIALNKNTHPQNQFAANTSLPELSPAGTSVFTATITGNITNSGTQMNIPPASIGNKNSGIVVTNDNSARNSGTSLRDKGIQGAYLIGDFTDVTPANKSIAPSNIKDSITPEKLMALDGKIDDGKPDSGSIIAFSRSGNCFSGSQYNTNVTSDACSVAIAYLFIEKKSGIPAGGSSGYSNSGNGNSGNSGNGGSSGNSGSGCDAQCQCSNQGSGHVYTYSGCIYDPTGCNGDYNCQCRSMYGTYSFFDYSGRYGGGCENDYTNCSGNAYCQCYSTGGSWNGSSCNSGNNSGSGLYCDTNQCMRDAGGYCQSYCSGAYSGCSMGSCSDTTGCNGDQSCQCRYSTGNSYSYFDWSGRAGGGCEYDYTNCGGDPGCQCTNAGNSWNGYSCSSNSGSGIYCDYNQCQYNAGGYCASNCSSGQSCNGMGSCTSNCDSNQCQQDNGYGSCISTCSSGYSCNGMGSCYDPTGCNGDLNCTCRYNTGNNYAYYDWSGRTGGGCQYDYTNCGGDPNCQCSYYSGNLYYGSCITCNTNNCESYNGMGGCSSTCGSGSCNGMGQCSYSLYCDPNQCQSDHGGYCASNCSGASACNGMGSCISTCDSNQCLQDNGMGSCVSTCGSGQSCNGMGGCNSNCDSSQCLQDNGYGSCVSTCSSGQSCNGMGSCYDPTGCNGDQSCMCRYNYGNSYYFYDYSGRYGYGCQVDYTNCGGDPSCQCSYYSGNMYYGSCVTCDPNNCQSYNGMGGCDSTCGSGYCVGGGSCNYY